MRILIAEDEKDLNRLITSRLKAEHYSVDSCFNGQEALEYLESADYDAVVLDIMMPVLDGLSVLRKIRRSNNSTPVILLTAKDSIEDRVSGLDAGANDYLVKPFDPEELLLRVKTLLRRADISVSHRIEIGSFIMDANATEVFNDNTPIPLTAREFKILYKLLSCPNKTFTRSQLLNEFWGMDSETTLRTVDNYISNLRDKLSCCKEFHLVTVRGFGYKAVIDK